MSDLKEDLDRALRTVTFGEPPVERAKRAGRRIRTRRRAALLAGVLAVAAVATGYPALAGRPAAPPAPLTGHPTQAPSPRPSDMAVSTAPPPATTQAPGGLASTTGEIAAGSVGDMKWQVSVIPPGPKNPVPSDSCYTVTINAGRDIQGPCYDLPPSLGAGLGVGQPAAFTNFSRDGDPTVTTVGEAAPDVTYFIVTFTDGQQLKLLPVTVAGHRYVAWMAPLSMTIDSVVAHLGGPYTDSGKTATAVPFQQPRESPVFGLWQQAGQAAPPRDTQVIGHGTAVGHAWQVTAYEGPWGTCFVPEVAAVADSAGSLCAQSAKLSTTGILSSIDGGPVGWGFGSAAPGVTTVRVTLSDGKTITAHPAGVGNEDLFAFAAGKGDTPVRWTAYDASGHQAGAGTAR
jgi:hypothetical protein